MVQRRAKGMFFATLIVPVFILILAANSTHLTGSPASLSEAELRTMALTAAQNAGLQGEPTSETYGYTSLGVWLTKNNENIGDGVYSRDASVFVYQVKGIITPRLFGYYIPNQQYETLVITLLAQDGWVFSVAAYPAGATPPDLQPVADIGSPVNIPTYAPYEPDDE